MEIKDKIIQLISIRTNLKIENIFESSFLVNDLCLDSVDLVDFSIDLEEVFNIKVNGIEIEQFDNFGTVENVIEFVFKKLNGTIKRKF